MNECQGCWALAFNSFHSVLPSLHSLQRTRQKQKTKDITSLRKITLPWSQVINQSNRVKKKQVSLTAGVIDQLGFGTYIASSGQVIRQNQSQQNVIDLNGQKTPGIINFMSCRTDFDIINCRKLIDIAWVLTHLPPIFNKIWQWSGFLWFYRVNKEIWIDVINRIWKSSWISGKIWIYWITLVAFKLALAQTLYYFVVPICVYALIYLLGVVKRCFQVWTFIQLKSLVA